MKKTGENAYIRIKKTYLSTYPRNVIRARNGNKKNLYKWIEK